MLLTPLLFFWESCLWSACIYQRISAKQQSGYWLYCRVNTSSEFLVTSNLGQGELYTLGGQGGLLAQSWCKLCLLIGSTETVLWDPWGWNRDLCVQASFSFSLPGHWDSGLLGSIQAYHPRNFSGKVAHIPHFSLFIWVSKALIHSQLQTIGSLLWYLTTQSLLIPLDHRRPKKRRGVRLRSWVLYQLWNACQAAKEDIPLFPPPIIYMMSGSWEGREKQFGNLNGELRRKWGDEWNVVIACSSVFLSKSLWKILLDLPLPLGWGEKLRDVEPRFCGKTDILQACKPKSLDRIRPKHSLKVNRNDSV